MIAEMLLAGILFGFGASTDSDSDDDAARSIEIEETALQERRRLHSGKVVAREVTRQTSRDGEREFQRRFTFHFSGETVRTDWVRSAQHVRTYVLRADGMYLTCGNAGSGTKEAAKRVYVDIGDRSPLLEHNLWIIDPRVFGLIPEPLYLRGFAALDVLLTRRDRRNVVVTEEGTVTKIVFELDNNKFVREWIDHAQGNSVVRLELESVHPGTQQAILNRMECVVARYDEGGVWFPERITSGRYVAGELKREVVLTIEEAEFNKPIDKELFELSTMNIPPSTLVIGAEDEHGSREWDGEKLVSVSVPIAKMAPKRNSLFWVSVVLSVLATASLIVYLATKRRAIGMT